MSQPVTDRSASRAPGITARSLPACVLAMLLVGVLTQYVEVILADGSAFAEHVLPLPVMTVLLVLSVGCSIVWAAGRFRLLSRREMLCVFFTMTLAAPLMTQGMWHRPVGLIAAPPRSGDFSYLDAYSDKLWPHGDNLAAGAVRQDNPAVTWQGNPPAWDEMTLFDGTRAAVPVLSNTSEDKSARSPSRHSTSRSVCSSSSTCSQACSWATCSTACSSGSAKRPASTRSSATCSATSSRWGPTSVTPRSC